MTCGYMRDVATANTWTFFKLLFRWNGSVWKAIHIELIVWLFIFVNIRTIYEFFLVNTDRVATYEHIVLRCREISGKCRTVMTFAIGFFVTYVSGRWWSIFMTIPWPDTCALQLTAYLRVRDETHEEEDKLFRQTIMRYLWLSYVLVFRDVSVRIKKRFPTIQSLTPTLLTDEELKKLKKSSKEMRPWLPIEWSLDYLRTARRRLLLDEFHHVEINQTILSYRQQLHEILSHDSITVPLVYVQAVHICTICYFIITCFASQTIYADQPSWTEIIDTYLPVYAIIEFIVFVGWLKTAFVMLNPFGMDDDDFEMNALIERNLMVSLSFINDFYDKPPKLVDMKVCLPTNLQTAVRENANPMHGSAVPVKINKVEQAILGEPKFAEFVSSVLPTGNTTVTGLHTNKPINEFHDLNKNFLPDYDPEKESDKKIKNPENSSREENAEHASRFVLKKEDLEAAVARLVDKRLAEEKNGIQSPQVQSTQNSYLEDVTQPTGTGESEKVMSSAIPKKTSFAKLKPRLDSRPNSARKPLNSARKSQEKNNPKPSGRNQASPLVTPLTTPVTTPHVSPHVSPHQDKSLKCEETQSDEQK